MLSRPALVVGHFLEDAAFEINPVFAAVIEDADHAIGQFHADRVEVRQVGVGRGLAYGFQRFAEFRVHQRDQFGAVSWRFAESLFFRGSMGQLA